MLAGKSEARIFTLSALAFLTAAAALAVPSGLERKPLPTITPNLNLLRSAHRGVTAYAPENTLPAIAKAIDLGYDYVEFDVCYTKDGVPVLLHDGTRFRTTNGFGPVSAYNLADLKKLDAGSWFKSEFKGAQVPTVEEALQLMQGRIKLYLDEKQPPRPELIRLLKKYNFFPDNMVVVHAGKNMPEFLKLEPSAPVMPLLMNGSEVDSLLQQYPTTVAFDTPCSALTPEMVLEAHRHGIMVFTDALRGSSRKCMRRPIEYGSDLIQIDNVNLFSSLLDEMRKEAVSSGPKSAP
jgi:glycerophosphoryl diester phosphodiesterase